MSFNLLPSIRVRLLALTLLIILTITVIAGIFYLRDRDKTTDELTALDKEGREISSLYPNYIDQARMDEKFKILYDKKQTEKGRYTALSNLAFFFGAAYSDANDARIRSYVLDLGMYGEKEFPKLYEKGPFNPVCQDPNCAPITPDEIKSVISSVKSSGIPKDDEQRINKNLLNASMVEDDAEDFKFYLYNQAYTDIKAVADSSSSSALLKTHEDLGRFLAKKYPEFWEHYTDPEIITESFLKK